MVNINCLRERPRLRREDRFFRRLESLSLLLRLSTLLSRESRRRRDFFSFSWSETRPLCDEVLELLERLRLRERDRDLGIFRMFVCQRATAQMFSSQVQLLLLLVRFFSKLDTSPEFDSFIR